MSIILVALSAAATFVIYFHEDLFVETCFMTQFELTVVLIV